MTVSSGQPDPVAARQRRARLLPRSTLALCRRPRPPRRCSRATSPTPACWPRRPTPTRPTRSSRKRRPHSITTRTQIFNFLHTQIGYNSYLGSVRGARGTLWSNAGNALDVASLGVALMRASGIPAQYVSGHAVAEPGPELILSMFPASYQTVGYIPAGTQVSDPAERPATAVRDRVALLVPVRRRQRHAGRRPAHGRRDDRPDVHDVDRHVHRRCRTTWKRRPRSSSSPRSTTPPTACSACPG